MWSHYTSPHIRLDSPMSVIQTNKHDSANLHCEGLREKRAIISRQFRPAPTNWIGLKSGQTRHMAHVEFLRVDYEASSINGQFLCQGFFSTVRSMTKTVGTLGVYHCHTTLDTHTLSNLSGVKEGAWLFPPNCVTKQKIHTYRSLYLESSFWKTFTHQIKTHAPIMYIHTNLSMANIGSIKALAVLRYSKHMQMTGRVFSGPSNPQTRWVTVSMNIKNEGDGNHKAM